MPSTANTFKCSLSRTRCLVMPAMCFLSVQPGARHSFYTAPGRSIIQISTVTTDECAIFPVHNKYVRLALCVGELLVPKVPALWLHAAIPQQLYASLSCILSWLLAQYQSWPLQTPSSART